MMNIEDKIGMLLGEGKYEDEYKAFPAKISALGKKIGQLAKDPNKKEELAKAKKRLAKMKEAYSDWTDERNAQGHVD